MLELDRAVRPANLLHKGCAVPGFHIRASSEVGREHVEVVGDDGIELVILPVRSDLRFICHLYRGFRLLGFGKLV